MADLSHNRHNTLHNFNAELHWRYCWLSSLLILSIYPFWHCIQLVSAYLSYTILFIHSCFVMTVCASPMWCYCTWTESCLCVLVSNVQSPATQTKTLLHHRWMLVMPWIMNNQINHWWSRSNVAVFRVTHYLTFLSSSNITGPNTNCEWSIWEIRSRSFGVVFFLRLLKIMHFNLVVLLMPFGGWTWCLGSVGGLSHAQDLTYCRN